MKLRRVCLLALTLFLLSGMVFAAEKGPIVDKVYFDVRMQQDIGIQDVAAGKSDVFYYGVEGPSIQGLDRATLDKLEIYSIPSGTWSLLLNPIPNAAPYTVEVDGKDYFNPLAIREVRFAINNLINRQYIVDEILGGAGGAMMTMATPGQPGTYRYNLIGSQLGLTAEGNEEQALKEINEALTAAAKLPALKGKLKEGKDWWTFNGQPVTVKFAIRVDDPQGRVKEGEYVAQQIEKAKIKVERLMWDRAKCNNEVYGGNPAKYQWQIYTEGWGAGATRAWWEHIVAQMYAPWYGYMPGGAQPANWNYTNDQIDALTQKAYAGQCLTEEEYWETALEGL
ncbi:MAG TPA: ABC transporter substrate-binding protein, partial [Firmicutes bacterium]|nr:ABC transporter substrate-binding protein [Bacillota bacterium]